MFTYDVPPFLGTGGVLVTGDVRLEDWIGDMVEGELGIALLRAELNEAVRFDAFDLGLAGVSVFLKNRLRSAIEEWRVFVGLMEIPELSTLEVDDGELGTE